MKIRSSRAPASAILLAPVAASLILVACGGDGDDAPYVPSKPAAFAPQADKLPADASEYDKHMQVARIAWAQNDDITAPHWCAVGVGSNPNLGDRTVVPITEIFDGFYFTGTVSVGQFVMKSPDGGYILFDTMNNAADVDNITIPQLTSAGIDPATLRGMVVTHGHGDHDGGALRLQTLYNTPSNPVTTVVGSADYAANKPYYANIQVDSTNPRVPQEITINGASFTAVSTPGHTPGTTSSILRVTYKGQPHQIAYWGGSGLPGSASGRLQYMQGVEAMYALIKERGVDASINSHAWEDKGLDRIRAIQDQGGIENSNPMIQGTAKIQLGFATLRTCTAARLSQVDATAFNPVWRPTSVDFYDGGLGGTGMVVAARVSNYFNVVTGGAVKFTAANGASCTATTDAEGVASCTLDAPAGVVTAEFDGKTESDGIELASAATRSVQ